MFLSPAAVAGLLAIVASDQSALKIDNSRLTYGSPGPDRSSAQVFPGDEVYLSFELSGFQTDPNGVAKVKLTTEVFGKDGKLEYKQDSGESPALDLFKGGKLHLNARVDVGNKTAAGTYKVKVTAVDVVGKGTASTEKEVTLLEPALAVVRAGLFADQALRASSQVFATGQPAFVGFSVVGFTREASTNHPKLKVELVVKDDKGAVVTDKPNIAIDAAQPNKVPATTQLLSGQFQIPLNKAGTFTLEIKVTDLANNKASQPAVLKLTVVDVK